MDRRRVQWRRRRRRRRGTVRERKGRRWPKQQDTAKCIKKTPRHTASNITIVTMTRMFFLLIFTAQTYELRRTKKSEVRSISKNIEKRKLQQNLTLNNYTQFDMCRDEHSKEIPKRCEKYTRRKNESLRFDMFLRLFSIFGPWPFRPFFSPIW